MERTASQRLVRSTFASLACATGAVVTSAALATRPERSPVLAAVNSGLALASAIFAVATATEALSRRLPPQTYRPTPSPLPTPFVSPTVPLPQAAPLSEAAPLLEAAPLSEPAPLPEASPLSAARPASAATLASTVDEMRDSLEKISRIAQAGALGDANAAQHAFALIARRTRESLELLAES